MKLETHIHTQKEEEKNRRGTPLQVSMCVSVVALMELVVVIVVVVSPFGKKGLLDGVGSVYTTQWS